MIRINLLPFREWRQRARLRRQLGLVGALAGMALLGVGLMWWQERRAIGELEAEKAQLAAEIQRLKPIVDEVNEFEKRDQHLRARLDVIGQLRRNQRGPVRVLDELSRTLPEQAWLEGIEESGGVYRVVGYALTTFAVADFLRNLQRVGEFAGVDLIATERATLANRELNKFSIQFQRAGGPTRPTSPATVQRRPGA
jgi:type IV pilus assembly protein PilN